jgi:hypothetical protein
MMTEETGPKPFVFVLMPFSSDFDDTYRLAIKPACERAGAYAERVDEQIFEGSILQRIFNQIAKADIIVSDLTDRNANVFYETGYAHALGKRTLLLTKNVDEIPFDLKHFPHIVYGGRLSELLNNLEKKVRWYIENPAKREVTPRNFIVRVNSVPLVNEPHIRISGTNLTGGFNLTLDIHNSVELEIRKLDFQLGLITPGMLRFSEWGLGSYTKVLNLEDGSCLHISGNVFTLLPGSWDTIRAYRLQNSGGERRYQTKQALSFCHKGVYGVGIS